MKVGRGIPMLCIRSIVHYINIYSRIVIQLNMYVKIITSSGFKSTILTDFVQGQLRVPFRFGRCLPEVHLLSGSCRLLSRLFDYARGSTQMEKKNRSRIYDLGVVPTRGNKKKMHYIRMQCIRLSGLAGDFQCRSGFLSTARVVFCDFSC